MLDALITWGFAIFTDDEEEKAEVAERGEEELDAEIL